MAIFTEGQLHRYRTEKLFQLGNGSLLSYPSNETITDLNYPKIDTGMFKSGMFIVFITKT